MQLRLRTKLTLVMTGLVLLVVAVLSVVFVAQLVEQALLEIDKRTTDVAQQVFEQAQRALTDAAESGLRPATDDPQDIHDYVRHAFEVSENLRKFATIVLLALVISTVLAAVVSGATLAPLRDISAQLDRISAGHYDAPSPEVKGFAGGADELGQVSRKITQVGQQLRGVHEIFSTLREHMDSVMAGLEDGLLLFTRDAR